MVTWQFWTLVGVISVLGIYIISSLSALIDAVGKINAWLGMSQEHLRSIQGTISSLSIDIQMVRRQIERYIERRLE